MNWWQAAADQLRVDHPDWTGVGRLAWDASRALDLLLEQPYIDTTRCGVMGHSLGGKIAFYAAALDTRFAACVASDFGFGFSFTNWDDDWYLGDRIQHADFERAHHELLALMAPRPFFLVGGEADCPASWHYILEAQRVYALHGRAHGAGFFHHAAGHRPTEQAMRLAYGWLAEQFGLDIDLAAIQL
jgi:acetyl esterase/lipase